MKFEIADGPDGQTFLNGFIHYYLCFNLFLNRGRHFYEEDRKRPTSDKIGT